MRLSEAIRLGSLTVPRPEELDITACAITMALNATGHQEVCTPLTETTAYNELLAEWPWLKDVKPTCPLCPYAHELRQESILYHMFDTHVMGTAPFKSMTIEQLADFIESIDPTPKEQEQEEPKHSDTWPCEHCAALDPEYLRKTTPAEV